MNIFGIGGAELVLVILIMIVVAGPKRMAQWAFILGKYMGKLRQMWAQVADVIQKEIDAAGVQVEIPKDLPTRQNIAKTVNQALKPYSAPLEKAAKEFEKDLKSVQTEVNAATSEATQQVTEARKQSVNVLKTPMPPDNRAVQPNAAPSTNGLGTWGNGTAAPAPENKESDLGTWSQSSSEK